jgi:hypothetical protein
VKSAPRGFERCGARELLGTARIAQRLELVQVFDIVTGLINNRRSWAGRISSPLETWSIFFAFPEA